jgi:hypothetical protein
MHLGRPMEELLCNFAATELTANLLWLESLLKSPHTATHMLASSFGILCTAMEEGVDNNIYTDTECQLLLCPMISA